jgi:2-polyprenyl-6-methoxyphenol hydroxylase-like FAD-dependent oxidoreductase
MTLRVDGVQYFPAGTGETDEQALSDESARTRLLDLDPACSLDSIVHRNIYNVHQRVAQKFRVGRVMLAGDVFSPEQSYWWFRSKLRYS